MTDDKKKVFSRQNILEKQKIVQENQEAQIVELRQAFEQVAQTSSGEKVLRYLFLLCGGDTGVIRRHKDGGINTEDILITLGTKAVWDVIRFNLVSDTIKKIERHNWEE